MNEKSVLHLFKMFLVYIVIKISSKILYKLKKKQDYILNILHFHQHKYLNKSSTTLNKRKILNAQYSISIHCGRKKGDVIPTGMIIVLI